MSGYYNSVMRTIYGLSDWEWYGIAAVLVVIGVTCMRGFSGPRV